MKRLIILYIVFLTGCCVHPWNYRKKANIKPIDRTTFGAMDYRGEGLLALYQVQCEIIEFLNKENH